MRNSNPWPRRAAIAHPNVSRFSGARGCRTKAAPASPAATIGATKATASATSMTIPAPGMFLTSSGDKRINRNRSQIATQIARQEIDAVRNDTHTLSTPTLAHQERDPRSLQPRLAFSRLLTEAVQRKCAADGVNVTNDQDECHPRPLKPSGLLNLIRLLSDEQ